MEIILKGIPQSTQNSYGQNGKRKFMYVEARAMKNWYIIQTKKQYKGEIIEDLLIADIKIYFKDKRRRDRDNYHKLSMDALEWIVYKDDSQIFDARVRKYIDKGNERIEILLSKMEDGKKTS